jgi:hypothetical protein
MAMTWYALKDLSALSAFASDHSPLAGQPAGGFQHPGADALSRLRPSGVRLTTLKQRYELACDLTLEQEFDLNLIHKDNDTQFHIERGVLEGV